MGYFSSFARPLQLVVLLSVAALLSQAQTSMNGVWVLKTPRNDGTMRKAFYEVKQEGTAVTHTPLSGRSPELPPPAARGGGRGGPPVPSGTFVNGKLHYEV